MILLGITFLFMLFSGAAVFWFMMCIITVILLPIHSMKIIKFRKMLLKHLSEHFIDFAAALLDLVCNINVFTYCDDSHILNDAKDHRVGMVISNHRTRVDWMFSGWFYNSLLNNSENLIIVLKDDLRSVPLFGWAMQMLQFIFLTR